MASRTRVPVVTLARSALCRTIGRDVPLTELANRMPMLGGDLDGTDAAADTLTIEWFPNRPDLLVPEGTGRALRAFLGVQPGLAKYPVAPARTHLTVALGVQTVRPFAALCFVRGLPVDDAYVRTLMETQEKLTFSPGRRRRKVAIGIHDAAGLQGPFTYDVVDPASLRFVPLGMQQAMTPREILVQHPKGREYGHLVGDGAVPVFRDAKGGVISLPPIINAAATAVTAATRDVLVDVTGTDARAVRQTIALLATCLAERGGAIEAVTIHDSTGTWTAPDLRPSEHILHTDDVAALLGLAWTGERVAACLQRMGHDAEAYDNKVHVKVAAWRQDILHPVDLMEDVGIGYGFENFPGELPQVLTFGGRLPHQDLEDALRALMVGHGAWEAKTLTLSNPQAEDLAWRRAAQPAVTLLNPVLDTQVQLRRTLLPSLLAVLAANRHRSLPQRLFEVGYVVTAAGDAWRNRPHFAAVEVAAKASFSDVKGLAESLLRDLRLPVRLVPSDHPGFIPGRSGAFVRAEPSVASGAPVPAPRVLGHFGELHPDTLVAFGLTAPATALELDLAPLMAASAP